MYSVYKKNLLSTNTLSEAEGRVSFSDSAVQVRPKTAKNLDNITFFFCTRVAAPRVVFYWRDFVVIRIHFRAVQLAVTATFGEGKKYHTTVPAG